MSETKRKRRKPIYVDDPNIFAVEGILKRRKTGSKTEYLIKWLGYNDTENLWVDELDITPDVVNEFNTVTKCRKRQALSATQTSDMRNEVETSVTQTSNMQNEGETSQPLVESNDSYFDEGIHNFGVNVQLHAITDDVRLFPSPKRGHVRRNLSKKVV